MADTQLDLIESYQAYQMAKALSKHLDTAEDPELELATALVTFETLAQKSDLYTCLDLAGVGLLSNVAVFWTSDGSILLIGWKNDEDLFIGTLPPDTKFHPVPFDTTTGKPAVLH